MNYFERGAAALSEHARLAGNQRDDTEGQLVSLLSDLRHMARHCEISFPTVLATSRMHYQQESGRAVRVRAVLSPGVAAEILATHNGAPDLGAALGVAVGGIASLCTQIETLPAAPLPEHYEPIALQGRALLNRLGRMVGPGAAAPAVGADLARMIDLAAQFIDEWRDDDGKDAESAAECEAAAAALERVRAGVGVDLRAVLEKARKDLGVVARFILDGEFNGADHQAMSTDDAYSTATLAVEAVRAVCADLDKALAPAWDGVERRKGARRLQAWGESAGNRSGVDRRKGGASAS